MLRCHLVAAHIPGATGFGPGVLLSVCFRGVPRRTRVLPEEHSLTWNEELVWPLDTCPLSATDTLSLRLRRWECPLLRGSLGATTVSLDQLVANPGLPMAVKDIPLLDHRERPTGCTVTFRCYCDARGPSGDVPVTSAHGQVPLEPPGVAAAERKEDFQVRVRVIRGRQLRGKNISPVVKVQIGKRSFRTRGRTGNNPYFNEVFCQDFRQTAEQLVAQPIHIQVLRSPNICTKPVIGVFELDIGTIYSAPGRSLSWKWLSLQHPRHGDGRSQGLLQVSLAVRRAGERAQEQGMPAGDEDVEANLLRPPPCTTTLQIRVFRAEDLPRGGDAGDWAEPAWPGLGGTRGSAKVSVRVGFAGRTLCTRGMPPDGGPEWNEALFFPLRLPPICDEILLEILRGSCPSKVLGRATLRLSQISRHPDELEEGTPGFFPCFGPSFLPFYGPRPDSARDSGLVYRGRVLLELCTHAGTPPGRQRVPVDAERAQSRLPRCQLGLCGVFYSATMVPGGAEPLRLELGIGGATAATAPGPPVFDGNLYHHLPWFGDKPVVAVTSQWEDAGHRWDSLNRLRALCQRLEKNLAELRGHDGDKAGDIGARLLRELAQDCTDALAWLEEQPTLTALDQQLRSSRRLLLQRLRRAAEAEPQQMPEPRRDALGTMAQGWLRRVAALAVEFLPAPAFPAHPLPGLRSLWGCSCPIPDAALTVSLVRPPCVPCVSPQPQAGVPDVQLWLLRGQLRVASARVAATDVLHSPRGPGACGPLCGRILTLFLVGAPGVPSWPYMSPCVPTCPFCAPTVPCVSTVLDIPPCPLGVPPCPLCAPHGAFVSLHVPLGRGDIQAQVRVRLWLGRVAESGDLARLLEGTLRFYCETHRGNSGQGGDSTGRGHLGGDNVRQCPLRPGPVSPQYEQQTRLWGTWGPRKLLGRPAFSDSCGRAGRPPERIQPPAGWRWDGPWSVERPRRALPRPEPAVSAVLEELYENQSRDPGGSWSPSGTASAGAASAGRRGDSAGDTSVSELSSPLVWQEEVARPQGRGVTSDWHVDMEGAVDEDGWQYGVGTEDGSPPAVWHSEGQHCHTLRRRRWLRVRHGDSDSGTREQDTDTLSTLQDPEELWEDEAWQPECFWGCSFQPKVPAGPRCRRRRWQRSLVPAEPTPVAPLFLLHGAPDRWIRMDKDGRWGMEGCRDGRRGGRMEGWRDGGLDGTLWSWVMMGQEHMGQEAAKPGDSRVPQPTPVLSQDTEDLTRDNPAVAPQLPGDSSLTPLQQPPPLILCTFQRPGRFQLRCYIFQALDLAPGSARTSLGGTPGRGPPAPLAAPGALTVSLSPDATAHVSFASRSQRTRAVRGALEPRWEQTLLFPRVPLFGDPRGVRDEPPAVVVEVFDQRGQVGDAAGTGTPSGRDGGTDGVINDKPNPVRALGPYRCPPPARQERLLGSGGAGSGSHTVVSMPDELLSLPVSSSLWNRCCSRFLATAPARMVHDLLSYLRNSGAEDEDNEDEEEEERDWWSKFYASMEDKDPQSRWGTNRDRMKIYGCELEAVPEFEGLQDFCQTFPLYKPGRSPLAGHDREPVGSFKGLFRIYPEPEGAGAAAAPRCFPRLPPSRPQRCLVRVYVVRALELSPRDVTGLSDPYVRVSLGKRTLGQREQYVPNSLEPVFGRMFELTATIPLEKDLRVTIMDHDKVPPDQEIGSTTIDLEDRLLSHFRAHCGLPARYRPAGPGGWRDQLCPSRALELLSARRGLPAPLFSPRGTALTLGGQSFELRHFERGHPPSRHPGAPRERLALHVLNMCELVPEHLETRSLQSSARPGLEQGKVQMWVDIFPTSLGPPGPPVSIDPRRAEGYELRCVVWRVRDTDLGDVNLLGQRMSDIYVSGWLDGLPEQRQQTDIHYRSLDGNGAFNWRFVFPFEFLAAEKLCAIRRKEHAWSLDETLLKVPPKLILQVWDNDKFKADDLLGILELELTRLRRPARSAHLCWATPQDRPWFSRPWFSRPWFSWPWFSRPWRRAPVPAPSPLNLFRRRRARGWWPCTVQEDSGQRLSGKLELTLELLTAREAEERPVGKGREEPNKHPTLPEPKRPKSSFLWLQSPLSLVRHGIRWRSLLWIGLGLAAFLLLLGLRSFFPGSLTVKVADPRRLLHPCGKEQPGTERPPAGRGMKP
ncbi:fer-1-like protein 5 [Chamaea fasciata]|uniref:fer-1-like protein 5 n=1 Tax=Chamaea fasciata TaxID=190680 RepID=UPI00336A92AB